MTDEAPPGPARHLLLQPPSQKRNWRFRYFEGGHPLPNEDSFAAARAALALLKKARKDTLVFFLISGGGSAMFDLPLDPEITLDDTMAFHRGTARLRRAHQRDQHPAQALLRRQRRPPGHRRARRHEGFAAASRRAACARSMRSPPDPPRPITPPSTKCARFWRIQPAPKLPPAVRAFFERDDLPESPGNKNWRPPFLAQASSEPTPLSRAESLPPQP